MYYPGDQIKEEPMGGDKEVVVWQRHGKQRSEGRLLRWIIKKLCMYRYDVN